MGGRGWDGKSVPPVADEMLQRWHREAHGETSRGTGTADEAAPNTTSQSQQ
jgi:hypothetical protein